MSIPPDPPTSRYATVRCRAWQVLPCCTEQLHATRAREVLPPERHGPSCWSRAIAPALVMATA